MPEQIAELSSGQYSLLYNTFSLVIVSMLFTGLFLVLARERVLPKYRIALLLSATVVFIAAYHYFRIFDNFNEAFESTTQSGVGAYGATTTQFNEGYRYVDWLLTVPLLLAETVAVLALAKAEQRRLLWKLIPASALMIILGYPGELSGETGTRLFWGTLSTLPFLYILYVLFVEMGRSLERQPREVVHTIKMLRLALVGLWGVYPIAYLAPVVGFDGADSFVVRNVGYALADIGAKAAFGLVIYKIARVKSELEAPGLLDAGEFPGRDRESLPVQAGVYDSVEQQAVGGRDEINADGARRDDRGYSPTG